MGRHLYVAQGATLSQMLAVIRGYGDFLGSNVKHQVITEDCIPIIEHFEVCSDSWLQIHLPPSGVLSKFEKPESPTTALDSGGEDRGQ